MLMPSRRWTSASRPWFWHRHQCDVPRIKCDTERYAGVSQRAHLLADPKGPALPVRPFPTVGRPLHRLEVENPVLLEAAVRIAGEDEMVALFQRVLLNAPPLE